MTRNRWFWLSLLCCAAMGCWAKTTQGDLTTFTLAPWVTYSFVGLGFLLMVAGILMLWQKRDVWGRLAGVALLTILPAVAWLAAYRATLEYVTFTDDTMEYPINGVFGGKKTLNFADAERFEFVIKQVPGQRGRPAESVTPVFFMKDGHTEEVGIVILRGEALDELLSRLKKRNIPVTGDRRGL